MADETRYQTERTNNLRARELDADEIKAVADVEKYGCHQLHVAASCAGANWSYTLGIFDTSANPELVVVGLKSETAQHALNLAHDLMSAGTDLTAGRHRDIVGEVEVIFRPAAEHWVREMMGWTNWYQGDWKFPVLQLIYPDLDNRFQWEEGFTEYFHQPLLQADAPQTEVEEDFKKSLDPESSFFDWAFPDPPHTKAYLSKTVQSGEEAVTYVSHDEDGDWQFLGDRMSEGGGPVLSCLHHPIDNDATLKEQADLPRGWYAERDAAGERWTRALHLGHDEK